MVFRFPCAPAVIGFALLLSACGELSPLKLPPKYAELTLETAKIEWTPGPAALALPSGASVNIPAGADYAFDFYAKAYDVQTTGDYADSTEATIRIGTATLRIDYRPDGYVPDTDYCHLDLARAKAGTQARIAQRNAGIEDPAKKRAMGLWTLAPRYVKPDHELMYGRLAGTNAKPRANLFVAKLIRRGFYLFTWSGSQQEAGTALAAGHPARQVLASFRPVADGAYEQHESGDALSGYTVAGFWDAPETAPAYANTPQDCQ
jgi:hypothetical protein